MKNQIGDIIKKWAIGCFSIIKKCAIGCLCVIKKCRQFGAWIAKICRQFGAWIAEKWRARWKWYVICFWIIATPILLLTFFALMEKIFEWAKVLHLIGIKKIDTILDPLLTVSGGLLAVVGVYLTYGRLGQIKKQTEDQVEQTKNQVEQTKIQTKAIKIQEQGQVSERIKTGLELLSSKEEEIQISAVTFFDKLARDADKTGDRYTVEEVFNMLCNYVRNITVKGSYFRYNEKKPSPVVEAIIYALFRREGAQETYQGCKANLTQAYLGGASLRKAHLEGADLSRAQLKGANLRWAQLKGANLSRAQLKGANLSRAHLEGANLRRAHLEGANLSLAHLQEADLSGAHLEGAKLGHAHLEGADLSEANLERADLSWAQLKKACLIGANLKGADLKDANLEGAFLNFASLKDAKFEQANLKGAIFGEREVTIRGRKFTLDPADVEGADFRGARNWKKAHFTGAKNLDKKLPEDFDLNPPPHNPPTDAQIEMWHRQLLFLKRWQRASNRRRRQLCIFEGCKV